MISLKTIAIYSIVLAPILLDGCRTSEARSEVIVEPKSNTIKQIVEDLRILLQIRLQASDKQVINFINQSLSSNKSDLSSNANEFDLLADVFLSLISNIIELKGSNATTPERIEILFDTFLKSFLNRSNFAALDTNNQARYAESLSAAVVQGMQKARATDSSSGTITDGMTKLTSKLLADTKIENLDKLNLAGSFASGSVAGLTLINVSAQEIVPQCVDIITSTNTAYSDFLAASSSPNSDPTQQLSISRALISTFVAGLENWKTSGIDRSQMLVALLGTGLEIITQNNPAKLDFEQSELAKAIALTWLKSSGAESQDPSVSALFFGSLSFTLVSSVLSDVEVGSDADSLSTNLVAGMLSALEQRVTLGELETAIAQAAKGAIEVERLRAVADSLPEGDDSGDAPGPPEEEIAPPEV